MSVNFIENLELGMEHFHKQGAFLTVKSGDKVNSMTISWGYIGYQWSRPVFIIMVRKSRYTYELIENSSEFTVSIPLDGNLKKALSICGTKSGRELDKYEAAGLTLADGRKVNTPVVKDCGLHYECKIVYKQLMDINFLSEKIVDAGYKSGDVHTLYYGEIVDSYLEER